MFKTLANAWKIPELRKKLMFTVFVLLIYRLCSVIPVPYINAAQLAAYFESTLSNTILGLYDAMSGSAFSAATILALGIQPYINASIIIQLLCVAIPALERMSKEEGEEGKKKIERITRYTTVGLGLLLGFAYYTMMRNYETQGLTLITQNGFLPAVVIILAFTAGACFVMWMGEQITEFGIGNGISMILFANIIAGLPGGLSRLLGLDWWMSVIIVVAMALLVVFIIFINDAERRIQVQYAKRVVGRKMYGGQNTNLPIKVAMSGVMPVIFASSICSIPATICAFIPGATDGWAYKYLFSPNSWVYFAFYVLMIFFFSWFYSTIQYDPVEISNNLKKNGGFIPGFRPGKPTSDFIKKVINKIVVFGAVYLAIVAGLPIVAGNLMTSVQNLAIGGTSVIIVVGVALETVKALEAQMLMRHYKGFLD
ncbi:MAG: preprotein translocase subunit SecY [Oscillospiraceae bacterium]|nr:preprotein translocase subunit SecY [Oscillospiraceae bacterium]